MVSPWSKQPAPVPLWEPDPPRPPVDEPAAADIVEEEPVKPKPKPRRKTKKSTKS